MSHFLSWRDFTGSVPEKFHKATLWQGDHVMIGVNCLEPGQVQPVHAHSGADKFYFVLEGKGSFQVGEEEIVAESGIVVVAPANIPHGVKNRGDERLSPLVAIAPGIK
jgi:quercetin dioxygenase-like cupin family protein